MKKQNKTWQEQLQKVLTDKSGYDPKLDDDYNENDDVFGTNIDWNLKSVRNFLTKIEKMGATDITIPDCETIKFSLPEIGCGFTSSFPDNEYRSNILLYVMTMYPRPCDVTYNKKKDQLTLSWDY